MNKSEVLIIEPGCINKVSEVLSAHIGVGKILYVSDAIVDKLYGEVVKEQINEVGVLREEYVDYNTISYSMSIAERVIATDIRCIVGIGGGKVLDVCKYAAYTAKIPFLSIPTTAANDGIASPIAVLKRKDDKPKSLGCAVPTYMLVDSDVISTCPKQLIKAGIGDTISNYTALMDWKLACRRGRESMNGYAYLMSMNALDMLLKANYTGICPEFVGVLINSLILSGIAMDFAGTSRPVSGSEHLFCHALDYYCSAKNLHGIQTALGTVAVLKLLHEDTDEIAGYLHRYDVDINPANLGIDEASFIYCLQNAQSMRPNRYTCLSENSWSETDYKTVYRWLCKEM